MHARYPRLSPHVVAFDTRREQLNHWDKTCWLTSHGDAPSIFMDCPFAVADFARMSKEETKTVSSDVACRLGHV